MRYSIVAAIALAFFSAANALTGPVEPHFMILSLPTESDISTMADNRVENIKASSAASDSNINTW